MREQEATPLLEKAMPAMLAAHAIASLARWFVGSRTLEQGSSINRIASSANMSPIGLAPEYDAGFLIRSVEIHVRSRSVCFDRVNQSIDPTVGSHLFRTNYRFWPDRQSQQRVSSKG